MFYRENFALAEAGFESNVRRDRASPFPRRQSCRQRQARTHRVRQRQQRLFWPGNSTAPDLPRDLAVLGEEDEHHYVAALERNGFFGPGSWYMNWKANLAYAERAKANWHLNMPVLFLHAAHDYICETLVSRLAEPMRSHCSNLTEVDDRLRALDGAGKAD